MCDKESENLVVFMSTLQQLPLVRVGFDTGVERAV